MVTIINNELKEVMEIIESEDIKEINKYLATKKWIILTVFCGALTRFKPIDLPDKFHPSQTYTKTATFDVIGTRYILGRVKE